jgi:hypothetical protein
MSEHERDTAFLRQCLVYGDGSERRELEEGIAQILRDQRCLRRAMWLMVLLMALVLVGMGYAAVFLGDFLYRLPPTLLKLGGAMGLGALLSLSGVTGLRVVYRHKLNSRREQCRQWVATFLEMRSAGPAHGAMPARLPASPTESPGVADRAVS